jgi:hypothetical protein
MQNVSFKSVDEFLEFLPPDELKIVEYLRQIIFSIIPGCIEELSYNVPYYRYHSNICFLWPASVTWGNVKNKGVRLGFVKGYLMHDDINYLEKGNRKQVYWKDFSDIREIDVDLLKAYLYEAVRIDQERIKTTKAKS